MDYRAQPSALPVDRTILVVTFRGQVHRLDRDTGAIVWTNELKGGGYDEAFLAVGFGVVIVSTSTSKVFCIDYLTGATRWEAATSSMGRATILIEPTQIICCKEGYIDCFSPDGGMLWRQPMAGTGLGRAALGLPGNVAQADDGHD